MTGKPIRFGLIVTGRGEALVLHEPLNAALACDVHCVFEIIRKFEQLRPRTGKKAALMITGSNQPAPTRDQELGLAALGYLRVEPANRYVLVLDDLEGHDPAPVFNRYRQALNDVLQKPGLAERAAVHFLVNMLEAYFFANSAAVNQVAGRSILAVDHSSDVETTIGHPKNQLSAQWPEYREIEHGVAITRMLDLTHVLSRHCECCWLRALVAWCFDRCARGTLWTDCEPLRSRLEKGCKSALTYSQPADPET